MRGATRCLPSRPPDGVSARYGKPPPLGRIAVACFCAVSRFSVALLIVVLLFLFVVVHSTGTSRISFEAVSLRSKVPSVAFCWRQGSRRTVGRCGRQFLSALEGRDAPVRQEEKLAAVVRFQGFPGDPLPFPTLVENFRDGATRQTGCIGKLGWSYLWMFIDLASATHSATDTCLS